MVRFTFEGLDYVMGVDGDTPWIDTPSGDQWNTAISVAEYIAARDERLSAHILNEFGTLMDSSAFSIMKAYTDVVRRRAAIARRIRNIMEAAEGVIPVPYSVIGHLNTLSEEYASANEDVLLTYRALGTSMRR